MYRLVVRAEPWAPSGPPARAWPTCANVRAPPATSHPAARSTERENPEKGGLRSARAGILRPSSPTTARENLHAVRHRASVRGDVKRPEKAFVLFPCGGEGPELEAGEASFLEDGRFARLIPKDEDATTVREQPGSAYVP